tara:strand:- start:6274 stop:6540 length:267 start_codon:yes stop_codon:yes gene_type:complete
MNRLDGIGIAVIASFVVCSFLSAYLGVFTLWGGIATVVGWLSLIAGIVMAANGKKLQSRVVFKPAPVSKVLSTTKDGIEMVSGKAGSA